MMISKLLLWDRYISRTLDSVAYKPAGSQVKTADVCLWSESTWQKRGRVGRVHHSLVRTWDAAFRITLTAVSISSGVRSALAVIRRLGCTGREAVSCSKWAATTTPTPANIHCKQNTTLLTKPLCHPVSETHTIGNVPTTAYNLVWSSHLKTSLITEPA